jgi:hypothetical protein
LGGETLATIRTAALTLGTHVVIASYSGDSSFTASNGMLSGGQVVSKASTHTVVVSSLNPSLVGQTVTFIATVSVNGPGTAAVASPTGLVVFYDHGVSIGQGTLHLSNGMAVASFSTSSLTLGSHPITAAYTSGDANFNPSPVSAVLTQTVQQSGSTGGGGGIPPIKFPFGLFLTSLPQADDASPAPQGTAVESDSNPARSPTQSPPGPADAGETGTTSEPAETDPFTLRTVATDSFFADARSGLGAD